MATVIEAVDKANDLDQQTAGDSKALHTTSISAWVGVLIENDESMKLHDAT